MYRVNILVIILILAWGRARGCLWNSDCPCKISPRGHIVINCNNRHLTSLPVLRLKNPDTTVEEIILSDNSIVEIPAFSFNHSSWKDLKSIDLSRNPLNQLHYDSFTGLEPSLTELILEDLTSENFHLVSLHLQKFINLEKLIVSNFRDQFLSDEMFKNMRKLKKISLNRGSISYIQQFAFRDLHDSLQELHLRNNQLKEVPTIALSGLNKLLTLSLGENPITFHKGAFQKMSNLKRLNIDHTTNNIEYGAFSGLEASLEMINVGVNRWTDASFFHILQLKNLNFIDAGNNQLTKLSLVLDGSMKSLKHLNLEMNRLNVIDTSTNRIESQTLQMLNLESNLFSEVHPDSFLHLPSLRLLNLKYCGSLRFNKNTFMSQKDSLERLYISSSKITGAKWEALTELQSLKELLASNCGLPNIPDLTFQQFSNLENLFLDQNYISQLTQMTFYGLENSLIKLSLSGNNLTTINRCSFEGLNRLDILDLKIENNPLNCNCDIKWLFDKINSLRDDPRNVPQISMLQWKCHEIDTMFKDLQQSHFSSCPQTPSPCETLTVPTFPTRPTTPSTNPYLSMHISDVTSNSFIVSWEPKVDFYSRISLKSFETSNIDNIVTNLSTTDDVLEYKISDLKSSTDYTVFLSMFFNNGIPEVVLKSPVKTLDQIDVMKGAIIGACVGIFIGILILAAVIYLIIVCRRKPKMPIIEMTDQSRRFVKYTDSVKSTNRNNYRESDRLKKIEPLYTDDVIKSTLDKMSNEEKYNLVNLLTKSTEGLNDKEDYSRVYDKGQYDEIPANYYEEIKEKHPISIKPLL